MRVRVRHGYNFIRKRSCRNRWGETRDEVLENLAGPCEIDVTLQEYKDQSWKLEPVVNGTLAQSECAISPTDHAATPGEGIPESDPDSETRGACQNCGTEHQVDASPYCSPECRREAFLAAQGNLVGEFSRSVEKPDIIEFVTDSQLLGLPISPPNKIRDSCDVETHK